jgi:hypothetical protein
MYAVVPGPRSPEPGERQIKIFFPELVTLFAPTSQNDTVPPPPQPVSAFNVISR